MTEQAKRSVITYALIAAAVGLLLLVAWFARSGSTWARLTLALLPVAGVIAWARLKPQQRRRAEASADAELGATATGRFWKWLIWVVYLFVGVIVFASLAKYFIPQ
jgi:hypothetical protein